MSTSPFYDSILKGTWAIENGKFVHPISKKTYTIDEYREMAYTPDAVQWRDQNKDRIAFVNTEGSMDKVSRSKIWDIIGSYKSDEGEDLTAAAAAFTVKKLVDQGITNLNQISIEYIPAFEGTLEEIPDGWGGYEQRIVGATPERWVYKNKATGAIINPVIFSDGAGVTVSLQANGSNGNYTLGMARREDPFEKLVSQVAQYVDPNSTGGSWSTQSGKSSGPGFGPEGMLRQLAASLWNRGVTNLSDVGVRDVDKSKLLFTPANPDSGTSEYWVNLKTQEYYWESEPKEVYNKRTGATLNTGSSLSLGSWGQGPGLTRASLGVDSNGKPVISTHGEDTGFDPMLLGLIITVATFGVGGPAAIGAFVTGGAATGVAAVAVGSATVSFVTNIAMGVPPLKALENSIKSAGAAYVGQMVGAMLPQELQAVGSSAVKQIIQTGKIDLAQLAIAGASGLAADAIAAETGLTKDLAGTLAGAGMAALTGKEKVAIEMLQNAAVRTVFNNFAAESGLSQQEKNFLQLGVGQLLNVAKGGKFNPISLVNDMMNLGMSQAAAAKVVGQNAPSDQRSQTAIGAVSSDSSGNLYSTDDDGNRLVLTGADAGRLYTAAEWNGIQAALNTGQAQFVSAVIKNMNDGVFTPEEAQQELKDAGYTATQIQRVIDANQQYITRAANAKSIIQEYTAPGSGYDRATALAALQRDAGYSAEDAERVLGNLDTNLRNQRSVGQFINAYAEPGSDVSRDAVIDQLKGLTINGQRQYSDADIEKLVGDADKVTTARNNYANITRDFLSGAATEKQLTDAMDAAGITGQARTDQLTYYRAIKAGGELTSSEATQAAVAGLNTWNLIPDRKGTQVVFALNDEGTPYVKEARDAQGRDVTNLFYGSSPQALQQYVTQENQKYADRMKSTLTKTAESFFAPGGAMTDAQAISALKATGLTEAMAKDVVAGWNSQKEAIGRNSININQETRTTSRMLSFEEFERMLGAVNVKDKLTERYQAYVTTNNAIYSLGKLPNGQFLFPGEVTGALDRAAAINALPRNSTVDAIAQEVFKGIQAGQAVGSPAQNLINSLNANLISFFPRVAAGLISDYKQDAANETAVILRGLAEIGSKSSDLLMPEFAAESKVRIENITNAKGWDKFSEAWKWATDSPLSLGSLAWATSKELSEDLVVSYALLGKALKVVGNAPGQAFGLVLADLGFNYGSIIEENIAQLTQEGLDPRTAAIVAGQGAMPAAIAETLVGMTLAKLPLEQKNFFKQLLTSPVRGAGDGLEETFNYVGNQLGMGRELNFNDGLTAFVVGQTIGTKADIQASVLSLLSPQGQGQLIRNLDELGYQVGIDPKLIPDDVKGTVTSIIGNTAVISGPNNQTYVLDVSNQNLTKDSVINIEGFDTKPVQLTTGQMDSLLSTIDGAFQNQVGRQATYDEISTNIQGVVGKSQNELEVILNQTAEGKNFDLVNTLYQTTLKRAPTKVELETALTGLKTGDLDSTKITNNIQSTQEFKDLRAAEEEADRKRISEDAARAVSISISISNSISLSEAAAKAEREAAARAAAEAEAEAERVSISNSISLSIAVREAEEAEIIRKAAEREADEKALIDWEAPNGEVLKIPKLWSEYTEAQKIKWLNDNNLHASKLQSIGVASKDIEYLVGKGLTKDTWKSEADLAAQAEAERISISNSISQSISASELEVENKRTIDWTSPNGTVVKIPAKWGDYTAEQKIAWLNEQKITATSFKNMGIADADIDAYVKLGLDRGGWKSEAELAAQAEADRAKIAEDARVAASVSQSLSQSESIRLREAAEAEARRISISESISLSQKLAAEAKAEADRISISNSISLSQKLSAEAKAEADRVSTSKSISESISISNKIKEDAAKAVSVSKSISESQSLSLSVSKSISTSQSISASISQSISTAASISASKSQSISAAASISASKSQSISASISQSISTAASISASKSQSISASTSQSISTAASISASKSQSISASTSQSISKSTSQSISTVASISASKSQSISLSQSLSASVSASISQSISNSISASISKVVSTSQSISASRSASVSTSASISQSNSQSISNSISASVSEELARDIRENTSASISNSISESIAMDRSTSISISKSVSISERLKTLDENQRVSLSNSISISDSLSQSASISVANSVSQSISASTSQSISQSISESASQSISTTVNPSVTVSQSTAVSQSISATINPSITVTQSVSTTVEPTVSVTTSINPSVTVSVTETPTESVTVTFTPTLVITTPTPTVTVTLAVTTPPPTIPWPPTLSFTETTSMPVTTTEAPTTTKPVTTKPVTTKPGPTTTPPPFPLFMVPGYDQTKRYIDYAQPNVPAPQFGPYDPFKAPNYLRPLQDAGNFGIAALVGAFNDGKPGNGGNQPK